MNFNVYVDKQTVVRLNRMAKTRRKSRNALVRQALANLLERDAKPDWPQAVLDFEGLPDTPCFESARKYLGAPIADPLR